MPSDRNVPSRGAASAEPPPPNLARQQQLGVTPRRLMEHVARGMDKAGVLGGIPINRPGTVEDCTALGQRLATQRAGATLLLHLELLHAPASHGLAALVVHQLLVDLSTVGKEQPLVPFAQAGELFANAIEEFAGEIELFGRESRVRHGAKVPATSPIRKAACAAAERASRRASADLMKTLRLWVGSMLVPLNSALPLSPCPLG